MLQIAFHEAPRLPHPALVDMSGRVVGKLTVVERFIDPSSKTGSARWLCRCTCGVELVVRGSQLRLSLTEGREPACHSCRETKEREPRVYRRRSATGKPPKVCKACAGLQDRIVGPKCRSCGRLYQERPPIHAADLPQRRF